MLRVLVAVLVIASGCSRTQARRAHRAGEVVTAGGLVGVLACGVAASLVPPHEDAIMTVGLAFVPISVFGALLYIVTDERANEDRVPALTRRERKRAAAWDMTQQAAAAARAMDCTQVQAIAPRVRELDMEFHISVFMRDVAIQRCMRER